MFESLVRAPEIEGGPWFNSKPLTTKSLKGKVVLVDFWTYSCVNCLRTLPYVRSWHEKYAKDGLVIIGVHTPEFDFEKDPANVERAVRKFGLKYPIVMDSDYKTWTNFSNHYWPAKFLVDGKGYIRYQHAGEGGYEETETRIQELLKEINSSLKFNQIKLEENSGHGGICYPQTPETYLGFERGRLLNGNYSEGQKTQYSDPGDHREGGIYLSGTWLAEAEYVQHAATDPRDYLAIQIKGVEANLVIKPSEPGEYEVEATLGGTPVKKELAGEDLVEVDGKTLIKITEPRMYRLLKSKQFFQGELRLSTASDKVQFYAFTFGGCPH